MCLDFEDQFSDVLTITCVIQLVRHIVLDSVRLAWYCFQHLFCFRCNDRLIVKSVS